MQPRINGVDAEFASDKRTEHPGRPTGKLPTITEGTVVAPIAIHPGEHLAEELEALCRSAAELARRLDVVRLPDS